MRYLKATRLRESVLSTFLSRTRGAPTAARCWCQSRCRRGPETQQRARELRWRRRHCPLNARDRCLALCCLPAPNTPHCARDEGKCGTKQRAGQTMRVVRAVFAPLVLTSRPTRTIRLKPARSCAACVAGLKRCKVEVQMRVVLCSCARTPCLDRRGRHAHAQAHGSSTAGLRAADAGQGVAGTRSRASSSRRCVAARSADDDKVKGDYYSRILKAEADPIPNRDNLKTNLQLGAAVAATLAVLVFLFLHSNGLA